MIKNGTGMTAVAVATMIAVSLVLANSADRIKPPSSKTIAPATVDIVNEVATDADPAAARRVLRRMLTIRTEPPKASVPVLARDPVPIPPRAQTKRRIAMIGAVTGEDGATMYWFRDLDGTAIYPLAPGGDSVDGWRLLSIDKGSAVLSIDGETFQVKEK